MIIKYTNAKYIDSMLGEGKVRLSTFWHFRAHEDAEIGDPDDGQAGFVFHNDTDAPWELPPSTLDAAAMSSPGHSRFSESKTLMPGDESWIESAGGFNTFMYSLTKADAPSKSLMKRLGYDAAVEIVDVDGFARHAATALLQFLTSELEIDQYGVTRVRLVIEPVRYVASKRRTITPSTVNDIGSPEEIAGIEFFTKLKTFEHQSELRIAFFLMNSETDETLSLDVKFPDLQPLIIGDGRIPRIATTLRRIESSEFLD